MRQKLPPDDVLIAHREAGLTYQQIADRYDVGIGRVQTRFDRIAGKPGEYVAPSSSVFLIAGSVPVELRAKKEAIGFGRVQSPDEFFQVEPLDLNDCRDLLREWTA